MKVLFRTEANKETGLGHSRRCLALAQYLLDMGHTCYLFSTHSEPDMLSVWKDESDKQLIMFIEEQSFNCGDLNDAAATVRLANEVQADWLVIDGYQFTKIFQEGLSSSSCKKLYIDDEHKSYINADLILNHNCQEQSGLKAGCLSGTEYFLASRELRNLIDERDDRQKQVDILVTLGGADKDNQGLNLAMKILEIVPGNRRVHLAFTGKPDDLDKTRQASKKSLGKLVIHEYPLLTDILPEISIAVCAGGVTSLELISLGIKCGVVVIADNQSGGATCLSDLGAVQICESSGDVIRFVENAISDNSTLQELGINGMRLVDGHGPKRVCQAMMDSSIH